MSLNACGPAVSHSMRECPGCGLFQTVPRLPSSAQASCVRCGTPLRRTHIDSSNRALALATASLAFYFVAVFAPFLSVDMVGQQRETTMISLPAAFVSDGAWELAILVVLTTVVLPLAKIGVVGLVLLGLRMANPPRFLPRLFSLYEAIGPWAMVEVFLLGVFVAFTRLGAIAKVEVGTALYAVGALMMTMVATDFVLDRDGVWEAMDERGLAPPPRAGTGPLISCGTCRRVSREAEGSACSRCGTTLHMRRPNSLSRTWACIVAAALLYLPANIYPVMTIVQLGHGQSSTILGGARELLEAGMWPLALLVFVASVAVPLLKLLSLVVMLIATHRGSAWRLRDRTWLYRIVEFIGRWSMIDVFMLSTLVGLVRAGQLASITPDMGAICFASVVVLTMIGAASFDPRVMWDVVEERARAPRRVADRKRGASLPANPKAV
jgi:paraquat-inducible protein A